MTLSALDALLGGASLRELESRGAPSVETISRWRNGKHTPRRDAVVRLAAALGQDVGVVADAVAATVAKARRDRETERRA